MKDKKKPSPSSRFRMRLIVAIPTILILFTIGSGFLVFHLTKRVYHFSPGTPASDIHVAIWVLIMGGVALVAGLLLAYGVTNPLKKMVKKGEEMFPSPTPIPQHNEISALTDVFNKISFEVGELKEKLEERYRFENIVTQSDKMQEVLKLITKVAGTDATVLIIGDSGTGKELVAEAIHQHSRRNDGPLIKVNCAAIPEGLLESELFGHEKGAFTGAIGRKMGRFELADQGTIFLDEIGDMNLSAQAKVLRVLQEMAFERVGGTHTVTVNVRVIAATNKNLSQEVREKRFREDLYFRLNTFPILLPPLRERREDIPLLVEHFVRESGRRIGLKVEGISNEAFDFLKRYDWPGNVRELENCIERAIIMAEGGLITPAHLPFYILSSQVSRVSSSLDETMAKIEREIIIEALRRADWVQSKAAKILGISERSLWHRVKKYRIGIKELQNL